MILVDAGPLVAFADAADQHHAACFAALQDVREPLGTIWPPLTEAMYILLDLPKARVALLQMFNRGALRLLPLDTSDLPRIHDLMLQYSDMRMDFADAALLRVAEREGIRTIFTVDRRDFSVYRLHGRTRPTLIP